MIVQILFAQIQIMKAQICLKNGKLYKKKSTINSFAI